MLLEVINLLGVAGRFQRTALYHYILSGSSRFKLYFEMRLMTKIIFVLDL
jgi:hypothetical protein